MTADPIRDALREAGEAICKRWSDGDDDECRAAHHADAAAAVAAFNRRLAEHYRTHGRPNSAAEHDDLAAAVERAAKEGA